MIHDPFILSYPYPTLNDITVQTGGPIFFPRRKKLKGYQKPTTNKGRVKNRKFKKSTI